MAGGGSSPKGAVGGGGFTSDGVGVPPAVGWGQEARGRGSGAHGILAKEEKEGGKERGGRHR
jgi:hypothetical protein